jgi:hypothetical protein
MAIRGTKYWAVGATGSQADYTDRFIRRGYWELGWSRGDQPKMDACVDQIRPRDWIAIKRMLGRGKSTMAIKAIGVVTDVDDAEREHARIYVKWIAFPVNKIVPLAGHAQSIKQVRDSDEIEGIFTL